MRRVIPVVVLIASAVGVAIGAAPALADFTVVRCAAPSTGHDQRLANVTSTTYRLPAGDLVAVTRATDSMTAAYAAERGTLVRVCERITIPR